MSVRRLSRYMNPTLRRAARRMTAKVLAKAFDVPHPWFDLISLAESARPQALLDVGAHVGEMTIEMARALPSIPVHAFEPSPESYQHLRNRVGKWPNAHAHNLALADTRGTATFHQNLNEQTNSLRENGTGNCSYLAGPTRQVGTIDVQVDTLDDWLSSRGIDGAVVMKVDVQGAENLLLQGGSRAFMHQVQAVLFEVEYQTMYKGSELALEFAFRLRDQFGLHIGQVYPARRVGAVAAWGDVLFVRVASRGE